MLTFSFTVLLSDSVSTAAYLSPMRLPVAVGVWWGVNWWAARDWGTSRGDGDGGDRRRRRPLADTAPGKTASKLTFSRSSELSLSEL